MITPFKEYMNEMAIAGYGDWTPSQEMIGNKSALVVRNNWVPKGSIISKMNVTYEVYKSPSGKEYIAGNFITTSTNDELFEIVFSIKLSERKDVGVIFKENNLMNVDGVMVKDDNRGDGIAISMYKFLVKHEKFTILGDEIQYFGARKLWARLSKMLDVIVDIIDISTEKVLEKNTTLHHGTDDWDFDKRVWDYTDSHKHIRLILKDIK